MRKIRNKGVSAVIGVILMVALTVAIAGTVYFYVTEILPKYEKEYDVHKNIEGNLTEITYSYANNDIDYFLTFDSNKTYFIYDNFGWELENYYSLTIYTNSNYDGWFIKEGTSTVKL